MEAYSEGNIVVGSQMHRLVPAEMQKGFESNPREGVRIGFVLGKIWPPNKFGLYMISVSLTTI